MEKETKIADKGANSANNLSCPISQPSKDVNIKQEGLKGWIKSLSEVTLIKLNSFVVTAIKISKVRAKFFQSDYLKKEKFALKKNTCKYISIIVLIIYISSFYILQPVIGSSIMILSIIPVLLFTWFFNLKYGLIMTEKELQKSYKEFEIAKEKAVESDRLKTLFLENMSHEIRTPMNGIIGFSDLLSDPGLTEKQKNKYIEVIQTSGQQLMNTITDIMDISKIEAGQLKVKEVKTNINDMLSDLYSLYHLPAKRKNIQLMINKSLTGPDSEVYTDYTKLRQVLENLVGNAIKFTENGHVKILCELNEEKLLFSIEDTGIGIRPEYQSTIFDRFSQADHSTTRIDGGTGLGLSISQAFIHEIGGDIWLKSETGKGTIFYFTIPYKPIKQIELIK